MNRQKRRRLARAIACWLSTSPVFAPCVLNVVLALVPLPPSAGNVRWIPILDLPIEP